MQSNTTLSHDLISATLSQHHLHYHYNQLISVDLGSLLNNHLDDVLSDYSLAYDNLRGNLHLPLSRTLSSQWISAADSKLQNLQKINEALSCNLAILKMWREAAHRALNQEGGDLS